jgi:hypothetical protein
MMAESRESTKPANLLKQAGASRKGLKEVELLHAINRGDIDRVIALLESYGATRSA